MKWVYPRNPRRTHVYAAANATVEDHAQVDAHCSPKTTRIHKIVDRVAFRRACRVRFAARTDDDALPGIPTYRGSLMDGHGGADERERNNGCRDGAHEDLLCDHMETGK